MYIKIENQENARRFTFFKKERIVKGEKVYNTDKSVFGTLSEGIKVGEVNGQAVWENDYWNVTFCGKAYEKALTLKDKDKVGITEFNVRNAYSKTTKKSYPQIVVTEFEILESKESVNENEDEKKNGFIDIPDNLPELPFE